MCLFLMLGLPLAFTLLVLDTYPRAERPDTRKAFARGLAAFIPVWLVARILGSLVPAAYGSLLLAFHEWADRTLPYAILPAAAYLVFYRPGESLPAGLGPRRLTAFYAGALCPVGLAETFRTWGENDPYVLFLLPFLLAATCLLMPRVASEIHDAYGPRLGVLIAAAVAATLVSSLGPFLLLAHLWPLAILLIGGAGACAWLLAYPELLRHPPVQLD